MNLSPAFHDLRAAYQSEMDDLTSDTEGRDVLRQRLADKRKSLDFLLQMTEAAPEMVAVVFHQGFRFKEPAVMDQVVSLEIDDVPEWDELRNAVKVPVVPWDERFTSAVANQVLIEADVSRKGRKAVVDKVSAILILQNYLDYRKLADAEARKSTA